MDSVIALAIVLLSAVLALPLVIKATYRSPAGGILLVGVPLVLTVIVAPPTVVVGGFRIEVAREVPALILLVIGTTRLVRYGKLSMIGILAGSFALFFVALLRGLLSYGLSGQLEYSGTFVLLSGFAYGASFQLSPSVRRSVLRALSWTSLAIVVLAVCIWIGLAGDARIPSPLALVLMQTGALYALHGLERSRGSRIHIGLAGLFIGVSILLQHRTVWVVAVVGILFIALRGGGRNVPKIAMVLAGAVAIGILAQSAGLLVGRSAYEADNLMASMEIAASDTRTFEWRQDYWRYTLQTHRERGPAAFIVGAGYGEPWIDAGPLSDRLEGPHNQYIDFLVRFGVFGVMAWLLLLVWAGWSLTKSARTGRGTGLANEALLMILLIQAVWSLTYWIDSWQPILFGLVVVGANEARRGGADLKTSSPSDVSAIRDISAAAL